MFTLLTLKNVVGKAVGALAEKQGTEPSLLKHSLDEVARLYDDEGGRRYRESLGKLTLMTNDEGMFEAYTRTLHCWERVHYLAQRNVYTHPDIAYYVGIFYSCLGIMELNEDMLNDTWKEQ